MNTNTRRPLADDPDVLIRHARTGTISREERVRIADLAPDVFANFFGEDVDKVSHALRYGCDRCPASKGERCYVRSQDRDVERLHPGQGQPPVLLHTRRVARSEQIRVRPMPATPTPRTSRTGTPRTSTIPDGGRMRRFRTAPVLSDMRAY